MPRADQLLVVQGHAPTRSAAQRLIHAKAVQWLSPQGWSVVTKAGAELASHTTLRITQDDEVRWASRAGLKLAAALEQTGLLVAGWQCLDVGQSTGGFSEVLITQGATQVIGVEVGHGQLHPRLRADPRIMALEHVHVRDLAHSALAQHKPAAGFDLLVADLSFISLAKSLSYMAPWLRPQGHALLLVKPQFEVGKAHIGKGGVVKDPQQHEQACQSVRQACQDLQWAVHQTIVMPITGGDGNQEFFIWAQAPP